MQGVVTGKDVLLHPLTIVRAWGLAAWLCCLWAALTRRRTTFLRVLYPASAAEPRLGAPVDRARPGAVVLAAAVSASRQGHLALAGPPDACSRWRSP